MIKRHRSELHRLIHGTQTVRGQSYPPPALAHDSSRYRVVVLPGDGIGAITPCSMLARADIYTLQGPDVVAQATRVLELISETSSTMKLSLEPHDFGGCAIDKHGDPLPPSTLKACQEADAILMGEL